MWKRMSWLLSLANGNTRRKALCKPLRSTVTSLGLFGMTDNYIITDRYVFISGRRPGIRTMAV
jgi:hypothetical protein